MCSSSSIDNAGPELRGGRCGTKVTVDLSNWQVDTQEAGFSGSVYRGMIGPKAPRAVRLPPPHILRVTAASRASESFLDSRLVLILFKRIVGE
jgi:hypothetical protein